MRQVVRDVYEHGAARVSPLTIGAFVPRWFMSACTWTLRKRCVRTSTFTAKARLAFTSGWSKRQDSYNALMRGWTNLRRPGGELCRSSLRTSRLSERRCRRYRCRAVGSPRPTGMDRECRGRRNRRHGL